jgi:hypothetical protein
MTQNKFQVLWLGADARLAESAANVARLEDGGFAATSNNEDVLRALASHPPEILLFDLKSSENDSLNIQCCGRLIWD